MGAEGGKEKVSLRELVVERLKERTGGTDGGRDVWVRVGSMRGDE